MENIALAGYVVCAIAYLVLGLLLATAWRGRQEGGLLLLAAVTSVFWAGMAAYQAVSGDWGAIVLMAAELIRDIAWLTFLFAVLFKGMGSERGEEKRPYFLRTLRALVVGLALGIATILGAAYFLGQVKLPTIIGFDLRVLATMMLALSGLVLVEQIFRNTPVSKRWAVKYLCLGLGAMFAYDFYLYANTLLVREMDESMWAVRGFIGAMVAPLIAVSAARNPQWSLDVFVSRAFVFHSSALFGAGVYLLAMAAGGYYIKLYGGDWGAAAQVIFFFGAGLVLVMLLFSGQMRARLRVFLSKHFFNYRYDYREEWLRFINTLSEAGLDAELRPRIISAIAQIVESGSGMLWSKGEDGEFRPVAGWNMPETVDYAPADNAALLAFLQMQNWVIDLTEVEVEKESYEGLEVPPWLQRLNDAWLVVPLFNMTSLVGFVVLGRPRARLQINWEVRDLLLTTGRQAASYLALLQTTESLVDARQFEAFNRLSAYVVHDLKNLVAQLSLVATNAAKHRENPAFLEDAFATVENAVSKMNRLLAQLRKGRVDNGKQKQVDLSALLGDVVRTHGEQKPSPQLQISCEQIPIVADADRLSAVLGHMIQNAQEATADDGEIRVRLRYDGNQALIEIEDTGCGMDAQFIRERLFRPFDTTKGNAGMGIGVYESREFIASLGGKMDVESEPGVGTLFKITLPMEATEQDGDVSTATTLVN